MSPQEQFNQDMEQAMDEISQANPLPPAPPAPAPSRYRRTVHEDEHTRIQTETEDLLDEDQDAVIERCIEVLQDQPDAFIVLAGTLLDDRGDGTGEVSLHGVVNGSGAQLTSLLCHLLDNHPQLWDALVKRQMMTFLRNMGHQGGGREGGEDTPPAQ